MGKPSDTRAMTEVTYVGIRNCPEKDQLLKSEPIGRQIVSIYALTFDCERHLEFADLVLAGRGEDEWPRTLYWQFLAATGRSGRAIVTRCQRFADLVARIQTEKYDGERGIIAVTDDGIRLNGSHRASVARVLGLRVLEVMVYRWETLFANGQVEHLRREALQKRAERFSHAGRAVYSSSSGLCLGEILYADMIPHSPLRRWRRGSHGQTMIPIYALRLADGSAAFCKADEVVIAEGED